MIDIPEMCSRNTFINYLHACSIVCVSVIVLEGRYKCFDVEENCGKLLFYNIILNICGTITPEWNQSLLTLMVVQFEN